MAKRKRKLSLGLGMMSLFTALTLIGGVAGSLAWYAYSRTVRFSFVGTTVSKSALLGVGLVDDDNYFTDQDLIDYNLYRETHDTHTIVFTRSRNGFSLQAIQKYLFKSPHAVEKLFPLTTRARAINDQSTLQLYKSPEYSVTDLTSPASPSDYVVLPFAFKIIDEQSDYVADKKVWLTDAVCTAQENIQNSVRVYVEGTNRNFLMKPADGANQTGSTKVGGVLDLDGDGTYDYNKNTMEEYCYGDFTNTPTHSTTPYPEEIPPVYDNVNGVTDLHASTFYAAHKTDVYTADIASAQPLVQEYETFGTVKPNESSDGHYYAGDHGIPICATANNSKIGYATFTIFVEGWDHSVVDKAAGYSFNLGLTFAIDRI